MKKSFIFFFICVYSILSLGCQGTKNFQQEKSVENTIVEKEILPMEVVEEISKSTDDFAGFKWGTNLKDMDKDLLGGRAPLHDIFDMYRDLTMDKAVGTRYLLFSKDILVGMQLTGLESNVVKEIEADLNAIYKKLPHDSRYRNLKPRFDTGFTIIEVELISQKITFTSKAFLKYEEEEKEKKIKENVQKALSPQRQLPNAS